MRLEVCLSSALWVLSRLIQLIGYSHVHLDLDAGEVDMVVLVSHHEILVAIVPEKWMRLHLNELICRSGRVALSIVLETLQMVQLNGDDAARLRVLDLECAIEDTDL